MGGTRPPISKPEAGYCLALVRLVVVAFGIHVSCCRQTTFAQAVSQAARARQERDYDNRGNRGQIDTGLVEGLAGLVRDLRGIGVVDYDGLAVIVDVLMDRDYVAVYVEAFLEGDQLDALLDLGCVELEGDIHGSAGLAGG